MVGLSRKTTWPNLDSSLRSGIDSSRWRGWRKSHETGATGTEIFSDSVNGAKTLLVGVGGTSVTDDIEERDDAGDADLPRVTSMKGSLTNSSKSPLLPSSESPSSEFSSTASIENKSF